MNSQQNTAEHKKLKKFDYYLIDFQQDLVKIIGKYKSNSHPLSSDEFLSEVNLYLVKNKQKIFDYVESQGKEFDLESFKHTSFIYCRNLIKWIYSRETDGKKKSGKWNANRVDKIYYTDEGEKSTLDIFLESHGVEAEVENINIGDKYKYILNEIKSRLTNNECKIFTSLQSGKKQKDIAEDLGVTRQAIDITYQKIVQKVKSIGVLKEGISSKVLNDEVFEKVTEGNNAINDFFKHNDHVYFNDVDKKVLSSILLKNPNTYTGEYISKNFLNGKYSEYQIINQSRWLKLGFLLKKKKQIYIKTFSDEEESQLIKLSTSGCPGEEISKKLGKPISSIRAKETHLYKTGVLLETSKMRIKRMKLLRRVFKSKLFDCIRVKHNVTECQKKRIVEYFNIGYEIIKLNKKNQNSDTIKEILSSKFNYLVSNVLIEGFINNDYMNFISEELKLPIYVIHGHRTTFVRKGLIPKYQQIKEKPYKNYEYSYILKALRSGYKYEEISKHINLNKSSVRSILINLVRKKTISKNDFKSFFESVNIEK